MSWNNVLVFLAGFFSCAFFIFLLADSSLEVPFGTGLVVFDGKTNAPSGHVDNKDIIVLEDRVILKISGVTVSGYADSGSMLPVLDKGTNGIRVVPSSEEDVQVGDIVSFRLGGFLVVHRVVEKGKDEDGIYFSMKGDSNLIGEGKIRFEDIEYITIGVIY
jgi:hypothetical protein